MLNLPFFSPIATFVKSYEYSTVTKYLQPYNFSQFLITTSYISHESDQGYVVTVQSVSDNIRLQRYKVAQVEVAQSTFQYMNKL